MLFVSILYILYLFQTLNGIYCTCARLSHARHGSWTHSRSFDAGDLFRRCYVHDPVEGLWLVLTRVSARGLAVYVWLLGCRVFGFAGGRCGRSRMLFRSVCAGEGRQRHNLPLLHPRCISTTLLSIFQHAY